MAIPAADVFQTAMTVDERARATSRGEALIAEYTTLQQLRKARALTQVELGRALGKDQVSISQIEKRADMLLSTLRGYVEGMGGKLSLVVEFDGGASVTLAGIGESDVALVDPQGVRPGSSPRR